MESTIDRTELRKFGLILGGGGLVLFGIFNAWWLCIASCVILISTFIQPLWLKIIYTPWMKIGNLLGWINTRILLGIVFFLIITPMGIMMRLLGKDPMQRCFEKKALSYRKIIIPQSPKHMEKPY